MKEENRTFFLDEQRKKLDEYEKQKTDIENRHGNSFPKYSKDSDWTSLMVDIAAIKRKISELEYNSSST